MSLAQALFTASAAIVLALGVMHIVYTFWGPKLTPRDPALQARMREVSPVISRQTTMWKTWIGFNVSHSLGAILFGTVYGYLALVHPTFLFQSGFLLAVGLVLLSIYAVVGKVYWFRTPLTGILLALASYLGGLVAALIP
jgi:hypothetical protein